MITIAKSTVKSRTFLLSFLYMWIQTSPVTVLYLLPRPKPLLGRDPVVEKPWSRPLNHFSPDPKANSKSISRLKIKEIKLT